MSGQVARTSSRGRERKTETKRSLTPSEVRMINEALRSVGEFGEVRLIVQKGRVRYVVTQMSHDVLKWGDGAGEGGHR
jgi:hypothetical protein